MRRDAVQDEVAARVAQLYTGTRLVDLRVGPLQRNYYSLLFTIGVPGGGDLVVKIPKTDLRARPTEGILPLTDDDRAMGHAEHDALKLMNDSWSGDDVRVRWVRSVGYVEEYNAVVTARVRAHEVWAPYVKLAAAKLLGRREPGLKLARSLERFGTALGRFHKQLGKASQFAGDGLAERLRHYADRLRGDGLADDLRATLDRAIDRIGVRGWESLETVTFKGIDIRNVLEADDGDLWLVDPGKTKRQACEADLARFLMTWRILFWGTPWFAARVSPHPSIESAFLRGYDAQARRDPSLLSAFLLKEALKHWTTARETLALKAWRAGTRRIVRALYIDPFYRRQLHVTLRAINT